MGAYSWTALFLVSFCGLALAQDVATSHSSCLDNVLSELLNKNPHKMNYERGLAGYDEELGGSRNAELGDTRVSSQLAALPEGSVWMNIGPGDGVAEHEVLGDPRFRNVRQVVSLDLRVNAGLVELQNGSKGRFSVLSGRTLRDATRAKVLDAWKGKVSYLTDNYAAASYDYDLRDTLQAELALLKVGGKAQINISLGQFGRRPYLTTIIKRASNPSIEEDAETPLTNWFERITGARVHVLGRTGVSDQALAVIIEKTDANPVLPQLDVVSYDASHHSPPERVLRDPNQ